MLFRGCFHFILTYRSGSKNRKPDAFSRQFSTDQLDPEPEPIPLHHAAIWQVKEQVRGAITVSTPEGAPLNTLFVPDAARSEILQGGHVSKLACHPGLSRTLHLLRQCFWWPTMSCDAKAYMRGLS